jgi:hypothetical protein
MQFFGLGNSFDPNRSNTVVSLIIVLGATLLCGFFAALRASTAGELQHQLAGPQSGRQPRSITPAARRVDIPKMDGGTRRLGIPTVADRIAQEVARRYLEPRLEPAFHADSYGYRPGKSAIDAVRRARQRCWRHDWVLDLDVKAYFDSIDLHRHHRDKRERNRKKHEARHFRAKEREIHKGKQRNGNAADDVHLLATNPIG